MGSRFGIERPSSELTVTCGYVVVSGLWAEKPKHEQLMRRPFEARHHLLVVVILESGFANTCNNLMQINK